MGLHPLAYYIGWIVTNYIKIFVVVFFLYFAVLPSFIDVKNFFEIIYIRVMRYS